VTQELATQERLLKEKEEEEEVKTYIFLTLGSSLNNSVNEFSEFNHCCNSLEFINLYDVLNNFYQQYLSAISANVSPKNGLLPLQQPLFYSFWMKILWDIALMVLILQTIWSQ
jgi:hypothetical protein